MCLLLATSPASLVSTVRQGLTAPLKPWGLSPPPLLAEEWPPAFQIVTSAIQVMYHIAQQLLFMALLNPAVGLNLRTVQLLS